jgi:DNA polymerase III alpha subunit
MLSYVMRSDNYGRQILSEDELFVAYMTDPDLCIRQCLVDKPINFDDILELQQKPKIIVYEESNKSIEDFDIDYQNNWYMPNEYYVMDIAQYILDLCKEDHELQRVGEELIKFQERDMFPLLRYCKYLVDTMRKNNVVWGVGRGSSVSSYVLYLLGVHRINSIHYDLSIDEFLK